MASLIFCANLFKVHGFNILHIPQLRNHWYQVNIMVTVLCFTAHWSLMKYFIEIE